VRVDQVKLVRNTLINAYKNTKYYKSLFDRVDFNPHRFSQLSQLKQIPYLDRNVIRQNFTGLTVESKKRYIINSTSGTTGEKLSIIQPQRLFYAQKAAFLFRFYYLHGIKPFDRRVTIGGRLFTRKPPYWFHNRYEHQLVVSAHNLNYSNAISYLNAINCFKPVFIQGHPSAIFLLAQNAIDHNYQMTTKLKAVFTTGEVLLDDSRNIIEKAFGAKVFQEYGSGESCFSAIETPERNGYMINYEHGYIELQDVAGSSLKEVVATSLQNDIMPLIRYKVGDYVEPFGSVYNGNYSFPHLFKKVIGRSDDLLENVGGETILPVTIRSTIKPLLKPFTNYQIIQESRTSLAVKLLDPQKSINTTQLKSRLKKIWGNKININISYPSTLVTNGGKVRNIVKGF